MDALLANVTNESVHYIYKQLKKDKNKRKLNVIIEHITSIAIKTVLPYMYTILGILLVMFCTNLLQFYYYLKSFIANKGSLEMLTHQQS
jgi:hypothetical protein